MAAIAVPYRTRPCRPVRCPSSPPAPARRAAARPSPLPPPRRLHRKDRLTRRERLVLLASTVGFSMVLLDTTVVNVALGSIARDLSAGATTLEWVANAYTLVFAGLLLSTGLAADRLGARARLPRRPGHVRGRVGRRDARADRRRAHRRAGAARGGRGARAADVAVAAQPGLRGPDPAACARWGSGRRAPRRVVRDRPGARRRADPAGRLALDLRHQPPARAARRRAGAHAGQRRARRTGREGAAEPRPAGGRDRDAARAHVRPRRVRRHAAGARRASSSRWRSPRCSPSRSCGASARAPARSSRACSSPTAASPARPPAARCSTSPSTASCSSCRCSCSRSAASTRCRPGSRSCRSRCSSWRSRRSPGG